jgi:hypothetical protein
MAGIGTSLLSIIPVIGDAAVAAINGSISSA